MRLFIAWLLALGASMATVAAHPFLQNQMRAIVDPLQVQITISVSLKEILLAERTAADADGGFDADQLAIAAEKHGSYLLAHLQLTADGTPLPGHVRRLTPPDRFTSAEQTLYLYHLSYPFPSDHPAHLTLGHTMLKDFPYAPGVAWDLRYALQMEGQGCQGISSQLRIDQPFAFDTGWKPEPHSGVISAVFGPLLIVVALSFATWRWLRGWSQKYRIY